jgi:predicted dinucleotide-binding enzyme
MKFAVLGSGFAGRTLAAGLAHLGHYVTIGTRDVTATRQKNRGDHRQPHRKWAGHTSGGARSLLQIKRYS